MRKVGKAVIRDANQPVERSEREVFFAALDCATPAERAEFLDRACGGNLTLRRRVAGLLADHFAADNFMQKPAAELARAAAATPQLAEATGTIIGRYELLEKLGEGGFGAVYLAEQREPFKRRVALKIIKLGMDTRQVVARFEAERQALALMDHPNIAKVFDGGVIGDPDSQLTHSQRSTPNAQLLLGRPYFVMELVRGIKITDYCDQNNFSPRGRLELFIMVCQAVQHAHQKGIIHRDLKPSNILVTLQDRAPVPKVIDFGVAKAMEQKLTDQTVVTQWQEFLGTPCYMSPEQAELNGLDIDTRSDIYSLGVLLYELLTGMTPFDAKRLLAAGLDEMRRIIREEEPVRPSKVVERLNESRVERPDIRDSHGRKTRHSQLKPLSTDLDWIVMKCLEKGRARRYDTANALAMDLKRHLNHEVVVARPPSAAYRLEKSFRRNRLAFTAAGAVALALALGTVVSSLEAHRATRAKAVATAAQQRAEQARTEEAQERSRAQRESNEKSRALAAARRSLYAADLALAQAALANGNLGHAHELLKKHRPQLGEEDLRGWEWRYLWRSSSSDERLTLGYHSNGVLCVAFSPKGDLLASGCRDGIVKLWELATGKLAAELPQPYKVQCVAFSRRGDTLATAACDRNVLLWDVPSRKERWRVPLASGLTSLAHAVPIAFWPQADTVLAIGDQDGVLSLWDTDKRTLLASNRVLEGPVVALAYSGDGRRLAVGSLAGLIRVCEASSLRPLVSLDNHKDVVAALSFAPNNRLLASSSWDHTIVLWNPQTGALLGRLTNHTAWVGGLAFSPDGRRLVSVSADHSIRFWDVASLQEISRLKGHEHEILKVAFSPNGELLATGSKDHSVKLWNAIPKTSIASAVALRAERRGTVSADRKVCLSLSDDGRVLLRDLKNLSLLQVFDLPLSNHSALALAPGGQTLAFGQPDGRIRIWRTTSHKFLADFAAHADKVVACRYSEDGRLLASVGEDQKVRVWEVGTLKLRCEYSAPHAGTNRMDYSIANHLVISPDGQRLAFGYLNEKMARGFVRVWDLGGRGEIANFAAHLEDLQDMAFTKDGQILATCSEDCMAKLWDLNDVSRPKAVLRGRLLAVNSLAFSPDERRLAVSGDSGGTKLYDVKSGQEVGTLKGGDRFVYHTYFVDEDTLFTAEGRAGALTGIFLWRAAAREETDAAAPASELSGRAPPKN